MIVLDTDVLSIVQCAEGPAFSDGVNPYTSPAGYFAPNAYGLHDTAGNVSEWCWDWYASNYYSALPGADPRGPASGPKRVFRGGRWDGYADHSRTAIRFSGDVVDRYFGIGFRSVLPPSQ